jgi:hypothetical protein
VNLKNLDLICCNYLFDENLIAIGKKCLKLEYIAVCNCGKLTDFGLISFVRFCKNLKEFVFCSSEFEDLNAIRLYLKVFN